MSKPKQVNQLIKRSQIDSENRQQQHSQNSKQWSNETEKLVLGLFARFGDLFGNKCKADGLNIKDDNGQYSTKFKLWCKKLHEAEITVEDVARGIKHLEESIRDSVRAGNEIWPPSYAAFIGHCDKQKQREEHKQWKGLPKTTVKPEELRRKMSEFRKELGL